MTNAATPVAVIFSGIPIANPALQPSISRFVLRKAGETYVESPSKIYTPIDAQGTSLGVAVVKYPTDDTAQRAIDSLNGTAIDANHTWRAERVTTSQLYAALEAQGLIDAGRLEGLGIIAQWA